MLVSKIKDLKSRILFQQSEKYNLINKFIFINTANKNKSHFYKMGSPLEKKKSQTKKNLKTKISGRCVFTNRGRGISRPYGISRIYLRELLQFGQIPGYSKAIW